MLKIEVGNWSGRLVSQGEVIGTSLVEYNSEFDVYLCFTQRPMWTMGTSPYLVATQGRGSPTHKCVVVLPCIADQRCVKCLIASGCHSCL